MSGVDYLKLYSSFLKRKEDRPTFEDLINSIDKHDLESATSCISIGSGTGIRDIKFIKACTPRLEKFIAIENDANSAAELTSNLASQIADIRTEVHQEAAQNWKGPDNPVDVILMFHSIYYFDKPERLELLKKCFNSWLKPGGIAFIIVRKEEENGEKHFINEISRSLNVTVGINANELKEEIQVLGLSVGEEYVYQTYLDLSNVDDEFVGFIKYLIKPGGHLEDSAIKEAIKKVAPDGKGFEVCSLFSVETNI